MTCRIDQGKEWHERNLLGESLADISRAEGHKSRNVVIGAVNRYRAAHNITASRQFVRSISHRLKPAAVKKRSRDFTPVVTVGSFMEQIDGRCCLHIAGEKPEQVFCGHPRKGSGPWCEGHLGMIYVAARGAA